MPTLSPSALSTGRRPAVRQSAAGDGCGGQHRAGDLRSARYRGCPRGVHLHRRSGGARDEDAMREDITGRHPVGRLGQPREIATTVLYLLSDESALVTSADFLLDGGYTSVRSGGGIRMNLPMCFLPETSYACPQSSRAEIIGLPEVSAHRIQCTKPNYERPFRPRQCSGSY